MGYMRLGNCRIREKDGHKKSIFDKVNEIKEDLRTLFPEIDDSRYINMLSRCRRKYRGVLYKGKIGKVLKLPVEFRFKDELSASELILYDYLLKNKLNPCTTYRWFIATRIPDDIKEKLSLGQISTKKAMEISANRKRVRESNLGLLMMEELRTIVRGL